MLYEGRNTLLSSTSPLFSHFFSQIQQKHFHAEVQEYNKRHVKVKKGFKEITDVQSVCLYFKTQTQEFHTAAVNMSVLKMELKLLQKGKSLKVSDFHRVQL